MSNEPTTIASVASLIAETLESHYRQDPAELFRQAGLDPDRMTDAQARYDRAKLMKLWDLAAEATSDPCIGLVVGFNIRPTSYHALGYSWLASRTLVEALHRLRRYHQVITTVPLEISVRELAQNYMLEVVYPDPAYPAPPIALDSFLASIVKLCRSASTPAFRPVEVWIEHDDRRCPETYIRLFEAPVRFSSVTNALYFDKAALDAPLPGDNLVLAEANDHVADRYLETLTPHKITTEVRRLLLELFPTGEVTQSNIASRLNRSLSTLQRQLQAEGTNYQTIREDTRRALGIEYVKDGKLSISEIAFLLGFSDQSNFSRAFKRWTERSPGQYRLDAAD